MSKKIPHIVMIPAIYTIDHFTMWTTHFVDMVIPTGSPSAIVALTHGSYRLAFAISSWAFVWHITPPLARLFIKFLSWLIRLFELVELGFDKIWNICGAQLWRLTRFCLVTAARRMEAFVNSSETSTNPTEENN